MACTSLIHQIEIDMVDVEANQCSLLNSAVFQTVG